MTALPERLFLLAVEYVEYMHTEQSQSEEHDKSYQSHISDSR